MYKIIGIDVKNNRYKVLDTSSNIESICTKEQLLQSGDLGFKVFGVLPDGQIVIWDTFYNLSMLSDNGRKKLIEILKSYNATIIIDDDIVNWVLTGNCMAFNISNRTNLENMFFRLKVESLDLRNFDTSKVTNMYSMFYGCKVRELDLRSFDTSNVTNMSCMFNECEAEILDLSSFDTSNVTDMGFTFCRCSAKSLDLRNFDESNLGYTVNMFNRFLGKEIILRRDQEKLISQVKRDGQGTKIRYV